MSKKDLVCFNSFDGGYEKEEKDEDVCDFLGYVTFYILLVFENGEGTICKTSFDFRKPITEDFIENLVSSVIDIYEKMYKVEVKGYKFVTEETYKEFDEENKDGVICRFNENNITVESTNEEMN